MSQAGASTVSSSGGTVVGPSSSTVGDIAIWNNTTGTLLADSGINIASSQILNFSGSNSAPSYSFASATNTGLYFSPNGGGEAVLTGNGYGTVIAGFNVTLSGGTTTISQGFILTGIENKTANYTLVASDSIVFVDTVAAAGAVTLQLPNGPITGQVYFIKDSTGAAATYNITVSGTTSSKNIDGATTFVINNTYGAIMLIYNGTQWSIF